LNRIAQLPASSRAEIFAETANRRALPEALVEKDFWVCWTLAQIFSIEQLREGLLFKGGTSLSKVFGVIERFSEDIDLAVDYTMLGFTGRTSPSCPGLIANEANGPARRDAPSMPELYIAGEFLDHLRTRCTEVLGPQGPWRLAVDEEDPNIVHFFYPPAVQAPVAYIAPRVTLELGTHADFIPHGQFTIRAFAAAEFPKLFERAEAPVTSLLAKRTFWEKATILHAEFHRPPAKTLPGRYSRHYYDVAMMAARPVKQEAFEDLDLLAAVVKHKQTFYASAWAQYPLAVPGTFKLAPPEARIQTLRRDYRDMAVMIFGEPPPFEQIMEKLAVLEKELNALRKKTGGE
jgi:hypothetical protein